MNRQAKVSAGWLASVFLLSTAVVALSSRTTGGEVFGVLLMAAGLHVMVWTVQTAARLRR